MGTTYSITTSNYIDKNLIENELTKINKIFSNWDKNSEISKINKLKINTPLKISNQMQEVLQTSQQIYKQTNGYFDITIGNLIDIWGFGVKNIQQKPDNKTIQQALKNSGPEYLKIKNNTITKSKNIKLNLSAIAKGYAVDRVAEILIQNNIDDFVVEIGGEVRVKGIKNIGIERVNNKPLAIKLQDEGIATSGDYRNYHIFNDEKFIHILDPKIGYPAKSDLISVSVANDKVMIADAYATAILAMGNKKAIEFIKKYQLKSVLIDKNNVIKYYYLK